MIESRWVKWWVVISMLSVAGFFAISTKPERRHAGYALAVVFAAPALYVLFRVHPRPARSRNRGSLLGDVDVFLAQVPELSSRFFGWAVPRGLAESPDAARFREWVWEHREAIGMDWEAMLPLVSAAYGEVLRAERPGAVWSKRAGDAVVEVPGRPWARRRVAIEMHEIVFLDI